MVTAAVVTCKRLSTMTISHFIGYRGRGRGRGGGDGWELDLHTALNKFAVK